MLPRRADEVLSVFAEGGAVAGPRRIRHLSLDIGPRGVDRRELVPSDAAIRHLLHSCLGVETPCAALFHERDRHRPRFPAENDNGPIIADGANDDGLLRRGIDAPPLLA